MPRAAVWGLVGVLVALAAGGSGWWIWTLRKEQRATSAELEQTRGVLAEREGQFAMVKEEHEKLSQEYEELKDRWAKTNEERAKLSGRSEQQTQEIAALTRERSGLQRELEEHRVQAHRLQADVAALKREAARKEGDIAALEGQLAEVASRSFSRAELEQVAQRLAQGHAEAQRLGERVAELSRSIEQLAQLQQPPKRQAASAKEAAGRPNDRLRRGQAREARRSAALYRSLGEAYLGAQQFHKATEAFEQSLQLHDDPAIHEKLAFLYTRLLSDREAAAHHLAAAPTRGMGFTALDSTARTQGLPRNSPKLVWRWLTD